MVRGPRVQDAAVRAIIIDTDIGDDIDDAYALAFALSSPELDVRAVTTVFGNATARTRLALKLLTVFGRADIPVATGISAPFIERTYLRERYTGDWVPRQSAVLTVDAPLPDPSPQHAVDLIVSTVMNADDAVTLVTIGALTNLATCLIREPRLADRAEVVMMGGSATRSRRPDLSQFYEHNVRCDPEAARVVFQSGIPITMVGLDVTLRCAMSAAHVRRLRDHGSATTTLLAELTAAWRQDSGRLPILHDPLAVAVAFDPTLVTTHPREVTIVTASEARGTTLAVDRPRPNAQVCFDVDAARFIELFMARILNTAHGEG